MAWPVYEDGDIREPGGRVSIGDGDTWCPGNQSEGVEMTDIKKPGEDRDDIKGDDPALRHQITCDKCGMVYEMRYIPEHCRMVEGEGYLCMNCNTVLDLTE